MTRKIRYSQMTDNERSRYLRADREKIILESGQDAIVELGQASGALEPTVVGWKYDGKLLPTAP